MSKSLQEIRDALDEVDQRIVDALAVRHELITLVPEARQEPAAETARDEIREHEILARCLVGDALQDAALEVARADLRGTGPRDRKSTGEDHTPP